MAAILRYNNSMPYAQNVLGWAAAYATGVVPVDLPPIVGPPPPLGSAHDEHPEGLGPSLPMNINGLPMYDMGPQEPLIDLSPPQLASTPPMFPWMTPTTPQGPAPVTRLPGCTLICIGGQSGAPGPLSPAPPLAPPPPDPLAGVALRAPARRTTAGSARQPTPGCTAAQPRRGRPEGLTSAETGRPTVSGAGRPGEYGARSSRLSRPHSRTPRLGGDVPS